MLYISVYFYAIHATEPEATTTICYVSTRILVYILLVYTAHDTTCYSHEYCAWSLCGLNIVYWISLLLVFFLLFSSMFILCSVYSSVHGYQQSDIH